MGISQLQLGIPEQEGAGRKMSAFVPKEFIFQPTLLVLRSLSKGEAGACRPPLPRFPPASWISKRDFTVLYPDDSKKKSSR